MLGEHAIVRSARRSHRMHEHVAVAMPEQRPRIGIGRCATRMTQQRDVRTERLRRDPGAGGAPLREQRVAGGNETLRHARRACPDNLAIRPIAEMIERERERCERRALHEPEQHLQTGGIDFVEKGERQVQGLGAQHTAAAFRMGRYGPFVKLRTHALPGPQGKEESHENTRGWGLLMILIVDAPYGECQPRRAADGRRRQSGNDVKERG